MKAFGRHSVVKKGEAIECLRGVSLCEWAHLDVLGELTPELAPWAFTAPGEELRDTFPAPPPGAVFFFRAGQGLAETLAGRFGIVVVRFRIPAREIVWEGVGRYHFHDPWEGESWVVAMKEVATRRILREWVAGVEFLVPPPLEGVRPEWIEAAPEVWVPWCEENRNPRPHRACIEWALRWVKK